MYSELTVKWHSELTYFEVSYLASYKVILRQIWYINYIILR